MGCLGGGAIEGEGGWESIDKPLPPADPKLFRLPETVCAIWAHSSVQEKILGEGTFTKNTCENTHRKNVSCRPLTRPQSFEPNALSRYTLPPSPTPAVALTAIPQTHNMLA